MTLGSGAYMAGVRPDFDVVVVSAGRTVVVVGDELAEPDEQLASVSGSIATPIEMSNFLKEYKRGRVVGWLSARIIYQDNLQ